MIMSNGSTRWGPQASAAIGAVTWLAWVMAVRPEWTAVLLLLSPFVLVPLGLRLAAGTGTGPEAPAIHRLGQIAPIPALAATASFHHGPGLLAALLTIPWLAFTVAVAMAGVGRLLSRRTLIDPGIGADAGLLFVAVGGVWLTISRAGLNPLGFSDAIVQLTAVHFHYAGFALPIVAGCAARHLDRSALVPVAVILGVPLTAVGIVAAGSLEWLAATLMALAGMATATLLLLISSGQRGAARSLIGTAGLALLAGMGLAIGWAWSIRFGWSFLGLESMAAIHGSLNALGFGLLGLIGLNMLDTTTSDRHAGVTNMHLGRPSIAQLQHVARAAIDEKTTNPVGLLHRSTPPGFEAKSWRRQIPNGDVNRAIEAIQQWRGHAAAGIIRSSSQPPIRVGETLALAIPVGPISISATCRIVEVVDEPDRYGFTYATLPHHPEDGEESFIVTGHDDGTADVSVTAVWRPATLANHLCPPLTRLLQNRAINRYLDGITTFAGQSTPTAADA